MKLITMDLAPKGVEVLYEAKRRWSDGRLYPKTFMVNGVYDCEEFVVHTAIGDFCPDQLAGWRPKGMLRATRHMGLPVGQDILARVKGLGKYRGQVRMLPLFYDMILQRYKNPESGMVFRDSGKAGNSRNWRVVAWQLLPTADDVEV